MASSSSPPRERLVRALSVTAYGLFTRTLFGADTPPAALRARFERFAARSRASLQRKYPGLTFADHRTTGVAIESLRTAPDTRAIVLHLHGGAFVFGSVASYRSRAMRLAYRFGAEVFVPEYRLAPEHPYPAALDDVLDAYRFVVRTRPGAPLFITGDSAGGGLVLSLLARLREAGDAMPDGAILLSPWTDLSASGAAALPGRGKDRWFSPAHLRKWATYYTGATDPRAPLLSPVFADLSRFPPLLVLAGGDELLLDDAARAVAVARSYGTDARLVVGAGMQHDWPLTMPWLPESRAAWREMERFVHERLGARRPAAQPRSEATYALR